MGWQKVNCLGWSWGVHLVQQMGPQMEHLRAMR